MEEQAKINAQYKAKAKNSFTTKMNLFIYNLASHGKDSFAIEDFKEYEIDKTLVQEYVSQYWQMEEDFPIRDRSIKTIYSDITKLLRKYKDLIKECEQYYVDRKFQEIFPLEDFKKLVAIQECHYCKITKDEIHEMGRSKLLNKKNLRGWNLEIDRLEPNLEYTKNNCVMACYWCNNAKTDEFTAEEFEMIGPVIQEIFRARKLKMQNDH